MIVPIVIRHSKGVNLHIPNGSRLLPIMHSERLFPMEPPRFLAVKPENAVMILINGERKNGSLKEKKRSLRIWSLRDLNMPLFYATPSFLR
jgi:hypothetical protein